MRNIMLVIKHEVVNMLSKGSFWFMTFLFPLLILGLNLGTQALAESAFENETQAIAQERIGQQIGYVDQAGMIAQLPPGMESFFLAFSDANSAQAALKSGQIKQYYLVPADFVENGEMTLFEAQFAPLRGIESSEAFQYVLRYNLTGNAGLAAALMNPLSSVQTHTMAPVKPQSEGMLTFWVSYAVMFIFFFAITMSSGFMLQSISKEKENRVIEVLLLSLRSRDLMLGKVLGLGAIAMFQMAVWMGGGLLFLDRGRDLVEGLSAFTLPSGFLLWGLGYFVLGFLLYASIMAAIGALAPTAREGNQFTFMVLLPLMIPMWVTTAFAQEPNGSLVTFLSLFPLTSPTSMITRMASTTVPAWQAAAGLLALAVTTYLFVLLSSRLFRADTLLSNAALSIQRVVQEIRRSPTRAR